MLLQLTSLTYFLFLTTTRTGPVQVERRPWRGRSHTLAAPLVASAARKSWPGGATTLSARTRGGPERTERRDGLDDCFGSPSRVALVRLVSRGRCVAFPPPRGAQPPISSQASPNGGAHSCWNAKTTSSTVSARLATCAMRRRRSAVSSGLSGRSAGRQQARYRGGLSRRRVDHLRGQDFGLAVVRAGHGVLSHAVSVGARPGASP